MKIQVNFYNSDSNNNDDVMMLPAIRTGNKNVPEDIVDFSSCIFHLDLDRYKFS